jgi:hypothetical protein
MTADARVVTAVNATSTSFYNGGGVTVTDRVIEYRTAPFADDNARRSTDCGVAGDAAPGWYASRGDVPAGEQITAVRFSSPIALDLGVGLGVVGHEVGDTRVGGV